MSRLPIVAHERDPRIAELEGINALLIRYRDENVSLRAENKLLKRLLTAATDALNNQIAAKVDPWDATPHEPPEPRAAMEVEPKDEHAEMLAWFKGNR